MPHPAGTRVSVDIPLVHVSVQAAGQAGLQGYVVGGRTGGAASVARHDSGPDSWWVWAAGVLRETGSMMGVASTQPYAHTQALGKSPLCCRSGTLAAGNKQRDHVTFHHTVFCLRGCWVLCMAPRHPAWVNAPTILAQPLGM